MMIGTLNEKSLHAALKQAIALDGDHFEVKVGRYVIDIVRGDELIEIQTGHFSPLKRKLRDLTETHRVRLVYPIAAHKTIVKVDGERVISRRKSPRKGDVYDLFAELVAIPELLIRPNFSLEILLIEVDEHRRYAGGRHWRKRGWVVDERHLVAIQERHHFTTPQQLSQLLPTKLPDPFTTADIAKQLGKTRRTAQQIAYCLRHMEQLQVAGKRGNAILYRKL